MKAHSTYYLLHVLHAWHVFRGWKNETRRHFSECAYQIKIFVIDLVNVLDY